MDTTFFVIAGLALGIAFVLLFATLLVDTRPDLNRYKVLAVQTALRNSTLVDLFEGNVPSLQFYRDRGVGHLLYDCKPSCAIVLFHDPSNPEKGSASVLVNPVLGKVLEVRASNNLIIAKTQEIADVRAFITKYPSAEITVHPIPGYSQVVYDIQTTQRTLSLVVKTTPEGGFVDLYIECDDGSGSVVVTINISNFIDRPNCQNDKVTVRGKL